ncbi:hypothetical protein CLF_100576 [Clonorchis sinensis]|uniref:Uncharacterized protein n=1 Tax=Clonorchis sinensis TaxID=79923 RepID=G7Y3S2_CLOSI|nr:hypothetical protein CLF_100576 [Clonorchis sinensis]
MCAFVTNQLADRCSQRYLKRFRQNMSSQLRLEQTSHVSIECKTRCAMPYLQGLVVLQMHGFTERPAPEEANTKNATTWTKVDKELYSLNEYLALFIPGRLAAEKVIQLSDAAIKTAMESLVDRRVRMSSFTPSKVVSLIVDTTVAQDPDNQSHKPGRSEPENPSYTQLARLIAGSSDTNTKQRRLQPNKPHKIRKIRKPLAGFRVRSSAKTSFMGASSKGLLLLDAATQRSRPHSDTFRTKPRQDAQEHKQTQVCPKSLNNSRSGHPKDGTEGATSSSDRNFRPWGEKISQMKSSPPNHPEREQKEWPPTGLVFMVEDIRQLLHKINAFCAFGPDEVYPKILKEMSVKLTNQFYLMFRQPLEAFNRVPQARYSKNSSLRNSRKNPTLGQGIAISQVIMSEMALSKVRETIPLTNSNDDACANNEEPTVKRKYWWIKGPKDQRRLLQRINWSEKDGVSETIAENHERMQEDWALASGHNIQVSCYSYPTQVDSMGSKSPGLYRPYLHIVACTGAVPFIWMIYNDCLFASQVCFGLHGLSETKAVSVLKKPFRGSSHLVPDCHTTKRKHEGWDTARLPKLTQGSREAEAVMEPRTFRNAQNFPLNPARLEFVEQWDVCGTRSSICRIYIEKYGIRYESFVRIYEHVRHAMTV